MITVYGKHIHVPPADRLLGYDAETGVSKLRILLGDGCFERYDSFKLDMICGRELNVLDLVREGDIISCVLDAEMGLSAGRYECQLRAEGAGKRWLSDWFFLRIGESIGAVEVLEKVPVAELYQIEQRLTALQGGAAAPDLGLVVEDGKLCVVYEED